MDKPGYTKGPWKATRSNPADVSTQGQGDVVDNAAYLREWAADIRKSNGKSVDADRLDSIAAEIDDLKRAARNRDMWKGQCERQADELTRLRTLLFSSRGEQGWRTMDSAPKDGTHIIGNTQWGAREIWWHKDTYEGEYWTDEGDSEPEPTGWIPMPGPVPTSLAGQGTDLVERVCHNDQLCIWGEELLCALECWIKAPESYDDSVQCAQAAKEEIKRIVTTAFELASPQPTAGGDAPTDRQTIKAPLPASFGEDTPEKREKLQRFAEAVSWPDGFSPDWTLSASEQIQVALTLALTKHVPGWPGATDEQLEAVAGEVLKVDALSAERVRVIKQAAMIIEGWTTAVNSKHLEGWGAHTNAVADMLAKRDAEMAAALRALGQQDTGGADHG